MGMRALADFGQLVRIRGVHPDIFCDPSTGPESGKNAVWLRNIISGVPHIPDGAFRMIRPERCSEASAVRHATCADD